MKKILIVLAFLAMLSLEAQQTISGTFSPADNYTWLIAYRLKPGTQNYIADTSIKNGAFALNIPATAEPGIYRLVYAVPQEEFYFDVIYTGKETIELSFDEESGVTFASSEENKIYSSYFRDINAAQQKIIKFYSEGKTDVNEFQESAAQIKSIQQNFEAKSKGLYSHQFIKANSPYIPANFESIQDYVANHKSSYFKALDFKNSTLQASGFLTDKATNYVFTALPLEQMTQLETEVAMQSNVKTVNEHLVGVSEHYELHVFYIIWTQAAASGFNDLSDYVYSEYLRALAITTNNQKIIDEIEVHNRLRIGAEAPEITWKEAGKQLSLSTMPSADCYVIVFWSSTCSHCLKELPVLHKKLMEDPNIKVLAVGLEDDDVTWKIESAKLDAFSHAIALGKWESDYANLYAISQTPTYFVLDKDKRIIAKPESEKGVIEFLERE